ncbi:ABC transporter permease [Paenibacillus hamazuiensis]|uniref:ABC transporter permease n=1 Tax=Paenibacillus hamazuiensis TaxID=2936508 RepID=UPI00200D0028|nr:iron export ABC transporter permease subunit FetB [Paenibacillus hamazuiensis]
MSSLALGFTLVFVIITMGISLWQKLGLERDIAVGTIRSAIQLFLVGYVLQFVFHADHPVFILFIVMIMIAVASWNAGSRAKVVPGIRLRVVLTIALTEALTMALLLGLHIVERTPQYIIPLSGMTIGSSMVVAGLFINHMNREVQSVSGEIEALLALGAAPRQAIHDSLKRAVRSSMIPTIDTMKTVGIVQLPGMMTGMIVAGASPVEAVKYQILIMFVLSASAAITGIFLAMLSYRLWFTKDERLRHT